MKQFCNTLVVCAIVATTTFGAATASLATKLHTRIVLSDEVSAYRRYVPPYQTRTYRGFADPSFGPDGRPYSVPPYLRNQCYVDMGYGRFQSCSNRN